MTTLKTGSDFSGVGAFDQALKRIGVTQDKLFACDMDKYARQTYIHNYGKPKYYPENVYDREIPEIPLDIYMTSPPCQAFSLAGKRKGEDDKRGVLFYNSLEFIQKNNPRYFIFENVKGLCSDDNGKTFQRWLDHLGGKSINGSPVIFPYKESVAYHIYYQVLNAKDFGVPQNRERIFIIGIRDDVDNDFTFPKPYPLQKRLKDVLELEVDEKYYLSNKMIKHLTTHNRSQDFIDEETVNANCITANYAKQSSDLQYLQIGALRGRNPDNPSDRSTGAYLEQRIEVNSQGISNTLTSVQKDNLVLNYRHHFEGFEGYKNLCPTIKSSSGSGNQILINKIRRLTPRECFRLMDFPDSFTWPVSDTQAYKQAGNSIVVNVLCEILLKLLKL